MARVCEKKGPGRPRNLGKEIEVATLLGEGVPVGEVARRTGVHRNTVGNIKNRIGDISKCVGVEDVHEQQREIERIRRQQEQLERERQEAQRQMVALRYKHAIQKLIALIESAADAVTKGRSVWTQVYLDKPLASEGTMHDLVAGASDDPQLEAEMTELSELLTAALGKLSSFQQKVIRSVFWEGQTANQVAEQMNASKSEVEEAMQQGVVLLRGDLADLEQ